MIEFAKPDNLIALPTKSNEWYTPHRYIEAARLVMDGIELDPASCKEANLVVRAERFYTVKDNGLAQAWEAKSIWLNPPYGSTNGHSNIGLFTRKLLREYQSGKVRQAILLSTTKTNTAWYSLLWDYPI